MTPRLMLLPLAFALVATVTFAIAEGEEAAATEKEMVLDPSTGEMVTAPEYGGTIRPIVNFKVEGLDPYFTFSAGWFIGLVNEKLGIGDWAIDRSVFGYDTLYMPEEILTGSLAESWENPDPLTYVVKIRDGVFWHDKAPVNGRQLTAHDVEYTWHRILGLGGGEPMTNIEGQDIGKIEWDSIAATDDSTVLFKLAAPSLDALRVILLGSHSATYVVAREAVEQFGDLQDWRNVVGTGPYELTDVLEGSSWTYTKNDDYWDFDEKFPDNRLPYADKVEYAIVNDPAAILSLMRSGQADLMGNIFNSHLTSVDQGVNLQKTNPELVLHPYSIRSETAFSFDNQKPPFNDIRVRQALSMAIDQDAIAENYMQGLGDASLAGPIGNAVHGYAVPPEEWPEEIAQYYRYDPEAAEKLLDEAGYPRGADGVRFKTNYEHYEFFDLGYYQIAMDYLRQIGIDVEIQVFSRADHIQRSREHTFDGIISTVWAGEYPGVTGAIANYNSGTQWHYNVNDGTFDEYYANALAATTIEERKEWTRKAGLRVAEQLWTIRGPVAPQFGAAQPWLKGYNGEADLGTTDKGQILARIWVDQDLKRELGG